MPKEEPKRKSKFRKALEVASGMVAVGVPSAIALRYAIPALLHNKVPDTPAPDISVPDISVPDIPAINTGGKSNLRRASQIAGGLMVGIPSAMALRRALPALKQFKGIYGPSMARAAKTKGMWSAIGRDTLNDKPGRDYVIRYYDSAIKKLLNKFTKRNVPDNLGERAYNKLIGAGDTVPKPGQVVYDMFTGDSAALAASTSGAHYAGPTSSLASRLKLEEKPNQYALLKSLGLGHMMPRASEQQLHQLVKDTVANSKLPASTSVFDALEKNFGAKFVIKDVGGIGLPTSGNHYSTGSINPEIKQLLSRTLGDARTTQPFKPAELREFHTKFLSEFRPPLERGRLSNWVNDLTNVWRFDPNASHEYRSHVVNGRVVPFATSAKTGPGYFSTFRNKAKADLEKAVQHVFDEASKSKIPGVADTMRNTPFGIDIGYDRLMRPTIYEMNPTLPMAHGAGSGQFILPWTRNSVGSAIKGRLPLAQKIQLAAGGLGTAGGAAGVYSGVTDNA